MTRPCICGHAKHDGLCVHRDFSGKHDCTCVEYREKPMRCPKWCGYVGCACEQEKR